MDPQLAKLLELSGFRLPAEPPPEPLAGLLIETAFLMAVADDRLNPSELDLLAEAMAFVRGQPLSTRDFEAALDRLNETRMRDGAEARLRVIAAGVSSAADRERLMRFGVVMALCDRRVVPREHGTLFMLGRALGQRPDQVVPLIEEVRQAIEAG